MKRFIVAAVVAAFALMSATSAMAVIANSKHDLSSTSTATIHSTLTGAAGLSSCQFCHTPHNASLVSNAPLWNRTLLGTGSYTTYGTTIAGTAANNLGPNSLTCLSCHDGTLSIGTVLVGPDQTTGFGTEAGQLNGKLNVTTGTGLNDLTPVLTNDHPVGFGVVLNVAGLPASFATMTTLGYKFYGGSNTMECATCHDPHLTTYTRFLRRPLAAMCSDCHVNK